ncbi:MAG: VWA domain-containing protein [Bryobacteraceae bacterium]
MFADSREGRPYVAILKAVDRHGLEHRRQSIVPPSVFNFLALMLLSTGIAGAQDAPDFHADVSLVHIDAAVLDAHNRPISGLTKGDFRIFDDDRQQPIVIFSSTQQPLDLLLLIDISRSMRPKVQEIAASSQAAIKELQPRDRVSVAVFNTRFRVVLAFTADRWAVEDTLDGVLRQSFGGGTAIRSSVSDAANQFPPLEKQEEQHRRAVLAITDNIGIPNRRETSVVRDLAEADAVLSGLIVSNRLATVSPANLLSPLGVKKPGGIEGVVEKTGGDLIYSDDLATAFPEMMRRLRSRYSLYYRLPESSRTRQERSVRIELNPETLMRFPGARVRARNRYKVPGAN